MFKGKKFTVTMMLLLSCTVSMIAQANYYYKGKKIPLTVGVDKVCVSIPKSNEVISRDVLNSINVIDNIKDDDFDIFVKKISLNIPNEKKSAVLYFYDASGKQINEQNISSTGKTEVSIIASDFVPRIYIYSLVVDGKCVSSKRMIVTR